MPLLPLWKSDENGLLGNRERRQYKNVSRFSLLKEGGSTGVVKTPRGKALECQNRSAPGNAIISLYQDPYSLSAHDSGKPLMADQNLLQLYSNAIIALSVV